MTRRRADAPHGLPVHCQTESFATIYHLRQQDSDRGRGPGWALRRRQAQAKERTTSRNQLAQLASSCRLQIELVTVRHPAIAALPLVDIADPVTWHVEPGHKNPVGGDRVQDALGS